MPNFSSLAGLEVAEKFLWGGVGGGVVCTVIFVSHPTVVLCCVGVLTILYLTALGLKFLTCRLHVKIAHLSRDPGSARDCT